jgi:hypothetical protein
MEKIKTMEEAMRNPDLDEVVQVDNELKTFVVDYVGKELQPETGNVTVEMVIDVLASHFPELVFALAEENFIRGYEQAADDLAEVGETVSASTSYEEAQDLSVEEYLEWKKTLRCYTDSLETAPTEDDE